MANDELHLELILGRKVYDSEGRSVGHLEEVIAERQGNELVVTEYLVGRAAMLQRFSIIHLSRTVLSLLGAKENTGYRVAWDKLEVTRDGSLRLLCPKHELESFSHQGGAKSQRADQKKRKTNASTQVR